MPALADKPVYFLAPVVSADPGVPGLLGDPVRADGVASSATRRRCSSPTCPVGVLVVLACSAMGVYGIVLAGWASGSTYPLLGGLRSRPPR